MWTFALTLAVTALAAVWALTGVFRRYALSHGLLDRPNGVEDEHVGIRRVRGRAVEEEGNFHAMRAGRWAPSMTPCRSAAANSAD